MTKYLVTYDTGVYKPKIRDWRQEKVTAVLEVEDGKKTGEVIKVIAVGGETSKRQEFFEGGIMQRELGKRKRLSAVQIITEG
jgi:hypothetical protein